MWWENCMGKLYLAIQGGKKRGGRKTGNGRTAG